MFPIFLNPRSGTSLTVAQEPLGTPSTAGMATSAGAHGTASAFFFEATATGYFGHAWFAERSDTSRRKRRKRCPNPTRRIRTKPPPALPAPAPGKPHLGQRGGGFGGGVELGVDVFVLII